MINKSILVGRITKDPTLKKTPTGKSVVSFTLAVNRKKYGNDKDQADFINCVAWNSQADFIANYIGKGRLLGIVGRLQSRTYDDASGRTVYVTEVVTDEVQALDYAENRRNTQPQPEPVTHYPNYEQHEGPIIDITSDDLPF